MNKGGERDLDSTAEFIINRWRDGKLGDCELDLKLNEWDGKPNQSAIEESIDSKIDRLVKEHFERVREAENENEEVYTSPNKSSTDISNSNEESDFDFTDKSNLLMETVASVNESTQPSSSLPSLLSNNQFKKNNKIKALLEKEKKLKRIRKTSDWGKSKPGSKKKWGGGSFKK